MILIIVAAVGLGGIIAGSSTGYTLITLAGVAIQCIAAAATCQRFWRCYKNVQISKRLFKLWGPAEAIDIEFKEVR